MAEFLINHAFRFAAFTLNYLSPSIIADIILHPFDFATVLLQIGFDPEGLKNEATTFVSAIAQYALFTFYIPYLFTSMQGIQFMGLPHPSMFYYVTYIYNKEGILGCYRGVLPKIFERIIMMYVNTTVKQAIKGVPSDTDTSREQDDEKFLQSLINNLCSQFFAVLASHPFHVIMVSSFAEFTYDNKSSMLKLTQSIYESDGCYGFFIGLAPRLIGELFSLTFSMIYTGIINRQVRTPEDSVAVQSPPQNGTPSVVSYLAEVSRFSAFKPRAKEYGFGIRRGDLGSKTWRKSQYLAFFNSVMGNFTQNQPVREAHTNNIARQQGSIQHGRLRSILTCLPLTSKVFYYMMIRDYISKKISYPFFLVCNCMIVLDSGWDKLPLLPYIVPIATFIHILVPKRSLGCRYSPTLIKSVIGNFMEDLV